MITTLKKNVVYQSFETRKEMKEKILSMIFSGKADKILYKGNPREINYKLMKKAMLVDYTQRIDPDIVKAQYESIITQTDEQEFCLIYKIR